METTVPDSLGNGVQYARSSCFRLDREPDRSGMSPPVLRTGTTPARRVAANVLSAVRAAFLRNAGRHPGASAARSWRAPLFLAMCLTILTRPAWPAEAAAAASDSARVARLVTLGRVWTAVRFLHPWLAHRPIDWDSALVAVIPRVRAARTEADFVAAIDDLLGALGDPATRVVQPDGERRRSPADPEPRGRWLSDGVLLVSITNYADLDDVWGSVGRLDRLAPMVDSARAVVVDLRRLGPGDPGMLQFIVAPSKLPGRLAGDPVRAPDVRNRGHRGYSGDSGMDWGYSSGWQVADGAVVGPGPDARWRPVAFVVNEGSGLPAVATAMLGAGRAELVAEGGFAEPGRVVRLPIGGGVEIQLRQTEPVFPDGSAGLRPDTVVSGNAVEVAVARLAARRERAPARRGPIAPAVMPTRPYPEMRSPELAYRLLAAYRIWGVFEYFYPYADLIAPDWAGVLEEFIPVFEAAADSVAYAEAVGRMLARTRDSHVMYGPTALDHERRAVLPAEIRWIEEQPLVTRVLDSAARRAGLRPGDVIAAVDGVPADSLIARLVRVRPASTRQALMASVLAHLGAGREPSDARVSIRRGARMHDVRVRRIPAAPPGGGPERDGPIIDRLPGNVGYVDLTRLTVFMVDSAFRQLGDTRGIVFDMRGYPRETFQVLARRLVDRAGVVAARFRVPHVSEPRGFGPIEDLVRRAGEDMDQLIGPPVGPRYAGRTVMLIDERAISQSEHTGLFLRAANGTRFVGTPTAGANGGITDLVLPGGIGAYFTGVEVRHPDGRQLQRIGLLPDIRVAPTIRGIRAGRDEVLERAVSYLRTAPIVSAAPPRSAGGRKPAGSSR